MALTPDQIESWPFASGQNGMFAEDEVRAVLRRVAEEMRATKAAPNAAAVEEASREARRRVLEAVSEANALLKRAEAERARILDEAWSASVAGRTRLVKTHEALLEAQQALDELRRRLNERP